ncbi:MAG: arginine--tRNA ligase [Methanoregulaceae archaeon]|nr:arginine--tRNA ligase [Methanoregulaceae archaeon]
MKRSYEYQRRHDCIVSILREATGKREVILNDGGSHADFATTQAFVEAKGLKQSPLQWATGFVKQYADQIASQAGATVEAKGPYINFHLDETYLPAALAEAVKAGYGTLPKSDERVVIEHTSANPNGPLHVGHIRNSIIGDTLVRCFRTTGKKVEVQYYVNDMGRQIAIVVYGFDHLDTGALPDEKPDHHIARVYIAANRALEQDPSVVDEVNQLMQKVELGVPDVVRRFRSAVGRCLEGFEVTMHRLSVSHDRFVWESEFIRNGDTDRLFGRIKRIPEYREDGKVWIDLTAEGFEKEYVLRRSDGTSVYAARDLAYHIWKARNFDRMIDVLGADHKLIGAQLIATLRLLGEKFPEIVHFEFVSLPEGSMSTRAGKFVSADELMDEVTMKAYDEVTSRRSDLDEDSRRRIAHSVAIAAIRYDIVKVSPEKSTVFDWKEALNFERQSGPYIQYAHARACSILEKAGDFDFAFELKTPHELLLARHVARFPAVIEDVVNELKPHLLAAYARELADHFNAFYHFDPVLQSEGMSRRSRLTLVLAVRNTLSEALGNLGIDAIRTM